jgi:ankyrin repeat protein
MPIIIRIQKDCTPEVADALDRLHKEMKKHTLKRSLRGAEAHHDEIETAIIQALAPLQNTQDFGDIISKTNDYKQTLAHFAVQFGYADLLRRLVGWNIDLAIADVNGFTALHCAYKKGDRACVDLLLENGASETVLDTLGRAPSHLMPEGFTLLNGHDRDTASDGQLEMEQKRDAPSLFQSTDSWHKVSDSDDEKSKIKAELAGLMHRSRSSSAASNSQSTLRSPPLPVSQITTVLRQLYIVIQVYDPLWCLENPFQSLINGRSEDELRGLAVSWAQYVHYRLRAAAPMV